VLREHATPQPRLINGHDTPQGGPDLSDELTQVPAARLVALMRGREVSPVEVLEAHLARAERLNPRLNAIVTFAPDALEQARASERAIARGDAPPLCGLPLTVKDTIDTRGLRTTSGSRARAGRVPERDAPAVARLRAAGAVILGKTNVSELALDYACENPVFGRTVNPHDAARTPGGSSGGCAAAVSAGLAPASLGSDMTGSIRIPAHFCGVLGLRPTPAAFDARGHFPPVEGACSLGASLGPLARTAEDLGLLFDALSRNPPGGSGGGRDQQSPGDSEPALKGLRIAFYTDDGVAPVTSETRRAVESAARALAGAGCEVEEARPPGVGRGPELWSKLFSRAVRAAVRETYAGREELRGPAARALLEREPPVISLEDYFAAWLERDRLRAELIEWMNGWPLVVAPVGAVPAFEHGERKAEAGGQTMSIFRAFSYSQTFNAYGLPAVSVPAGRTRGRLPVGVQIVGAPRAERLLLAAARAAERALGGWQPPPI
jgi:Asp-tRNA(Asn)/Glu-tRNA(Gln) amidotransferase A subunit family amidase